MSFYVIYGRRVESVRAARLFHYHISRRTIITDGHRQHSYTLLVKPR